MIDLEDHQRFRPDPQKPAALLRACPVYEASPLRSFDLDGLTTVLVKDETDRMGLGAFKSLGGVYAVARLIEDAYVSETGRKLTPGQFQDEAVARHAKSMVFVCASAGNHGLAVAAGARLFGANARIHLATTVPESFAVRLRSLNAEVVRSGEDYEASVAAAQDDARKTGATLLADGSWAGYVYPPSLVMEGYTVLAEELREFFEASGLWPTHVFLQGGVGGLAAAVAHMIRRNWAMQPTIIIVEPAAAPCIKQGILEQAVVEVDGPVSNMGRLDCKVASLVALDVLNDCADEFMLISDDDATDAVTVAGKFGVETTPSGAAGLAGLIVAARHSPESYKDSRPLVIISEGVAPNPDPD